MLRKHIDQHVVQAFDGRKFVPRSVLRVYFTERKIKDFLDLYHIERHKWEAISNDYLAVFTILLLIGKGNFILSFLPYNNLSDAHLPFYNCANWEPICHDLFEVFTKDQWAFCAQELRPDRLDDKWFHGDLIIPIITRSPLKSSDSTTFKVEVHSDYNLLTSKALKGLDSPRYFVLKSCRSDNTEVYANEVRGYRTLGQQKDISTYIARFYGSWRQGDTCNILLEYVDGGIGGNTLTDVFMGEHPTTEVDLIKFWDKLVRVIEPLCRIHCHGDKEDRNKIAVGVHQDIKSDNILKSQAHGHDPFDFTFKLADLGLAYIPQAATRDRINRGRDRPGTQMFSPPECFRDEHDKFIQRTMREANPKKDIWSLGCVLSEALVWSVLGRGGLQEYREHRRDVTNGIENMKNTAYSGCFHNGMKVSSAVSHMHDRVRKVHCAVVGLPEIIEDMLDDDVEQRLDALKVRKRLYQAIDTAKRIWVETDYPHPFGDKHNLHSSPEPSPGKLIRPNTFCVAPSNSASRFQHNQLERNDVIPELELIQESDVRDPRNNYDHHKATPLPKNLTRRVTEGQVPISSAARNILSQSRSRKTQNAQRRVEKALENPLPHLGRPSGAFKSPDGSCSVASNATVALDPTSNKDRTTTALPNSPHATIDQVLDWITQSKKTLLPGWNAPIMMSYLAYLRGKDQIFVIDTSASMRKHKPEIRKTFEALAYIVKRLDPDGIDIYFTTSGEVGHGSHREKLLVQLDKTKFDGHTMMESALARVLGNKKRWSTSFLNSNKNDGKSIYVFTDGMWHGNDDYLCGIPELIKRKVEKMDSRAKLGIQFIQFGNDAVGTSRLKELDDGLKQHGVMMDIIDTERHDGNVYKMLLGHMDSSWDHSAATSSDESRDLSAQQSSSS